MIAELLIKQAIARPDAFAIIEQNSARRTDFRELNERSNQLAIGFAGLGEYRRTETVHLARRFICVA
ncbi:MAG: hypothetical protein ACYYK0_02285 [Candidatus Eutrophobiaceae bacterium]